MSLQKPTIVLFDMDGTVIRHINPLLLHILEKIDDLSHKGARLFSWIFNRKIKSLLLVEFRDGKRKKLFVHRAMHKFRRKEIGEIVEPCPGIYDILDFLKSQKIPMGIISNGLGKGYGHDVLRKFSLDQYFEVTLFREDITRPKPYPDPILQALKEMTHYPDEKDVIWYIGDRHKDVKAALAAELYLPCDIQPIAYTLNAAIAILEHNMKPDHIIMGWPDLQIKLEEMFRDKDIEESKIKRIF